MSKKCSTCKLDKPLDQFPKSRKRPDGLHPRCSQCKAVYYQQNRGWILKQYGEYRSANAERLRAHAKKYIESRFFYKRAQNLLVRMAAAERTSLPQKCAEISRLWKKQRGICPVSGRRLNRQNAQLDHIHPLTRGGSSGIENLRWVHRDVNYAKRDLLDEEFFKLVEDIANFKNR